MSYLKHRCERGAERRNLDSLGIWVTWTVFLLRYPFRQTCILCERHMWYHSPYEGGVDSVTEGGDDFSVTRG